jgi:hypothetical protein
VLAGAGAGDTRFAREERAPTRTGGEP